MLHVVRAVLTAWLTGSGFDLAAFQVPLYIPFSELSMVGLALTHLIYRVTVGC